MADRLHRRHNSGNDTHAFVRPERSKVGKKKSYEKASSPISFAFFLCRLVPVMICIIASLWRIGLSIRSVSKQRLATPPDIVFAGFPVSSRSFSQVREQYKIDTEIREPMAVVELPDDFQGKYHPKSVQEFQKLASTLLDNTAVVNSGRAPSTYAVVSICIDMDLCVLSRSNHEYYTSAHGYDYVSLSKSIEGVPAKMLKYLLLGWAMNKEYKWLLMMDADALFTNSSITISSLLGEFNLNKDTSLIATRGGRWKEAHALNNGVFLIKNNEWSMQHLFQVFTSKWAFSRFLGKTLIDQPVQMSLLLAQNELQWPPIFEEEQGKHVMIIPKRRINSFRRDKFFSQTDEEEGGQWHPGDFIAHFASGSKYSLMVDLMEQEGLHGIPNVESRFPFNIPAKGEESNAGTCSCIDEKVACISRFHVIGVHKAGTKAILRYLSGHPSLTSTPFVEDPVRWLTDSVLPVDEKRCAEKRLKHPDRPTYIQRSRGSRGITTCSFKDYASLQAAFSTEQRTCDAGKLPKSGFQHHIYDEMVIWDRTFDRIRGVPLPKLFHLWQPTAKMLITVRDPVDVVYSAYNHFGVFSKKDPEHFDVFIKNVTDEWSKNKCIPSNYRQRLPRECIAAGGWVSRVMYAKYITAWIEHFPCSQIHIFDVSVDPKTEVKRLYDFIGVPDKAAAANVTAPTYFLQANSSAIQDYGLTRNKNPLNKAIYAPMLPETRVHLSRFFAPYNAELCDIIDTHPCLKVPLLEQYCN